MNKTILLKRSYLAGSKPASLNVGEIAINAKDEMMFIKNDNNLSELDIRNSSAIATGFDRYESKSIGKIQYYINSTIGQMYMLDQYGFFAKYNQDYFAEGTDYETDITDNTVVWYPHAWDRPIVAYSKKKRIQINQLKKVTLPNNSGLFYIIYDPDNDNLAYKQNRKDVDDSKDILLACIYINLDHNKVVFFADYRIDGRYKRNDLNFAKYINGFKSSFNVGTENALNKIESGTLDVSGKIFPIPTVKTNHFKILYKDDSDWIYEDVGNSITKIGYLNIYDPNTDNGNYILKQLGDGNFNIVHIFATYSNIDTFYCIVGQNEYRTLNDAQNGIKFDAKQLDLYKLPIELIRPLFSIIVDKNGHIQEYESGLYKYPLFELDHLEPEVTNPYILKQLSDDEKIELLDLNDFSHTNNNGVHSGESINPSDNHTSWIKFKINGNIKLDWNVSSEDRYDFLTITYDGDELVHVSGEENGQLELDAELGDNKELYIEYDKDQSVSEGQDKAWFEDLMLR